MSATPQPKYDLVGALERARKESARQHWREMVEEVYGDEAYIVFPWLKPGLIEAAEARGEWPPPLTITYGALYKWAVDQDKGKELLKGDFERFFAKRFPQKEKEAK